MTRNLYMVDLIKWKKLFCINSTPIENLESYCDVSVAIKRDDLNHPIIQGNKLRKLKYNLQYAIVNKKTCIATFGGAWSNHVVATAKASYLCGLESIGFIRGDELHNKPHLWSKTLHNANKYNMNLIFLSRKEYRLKQNSKVVKQVFVDNENKVHLVPEGGSNAMALKGISEIIGELEHQNQNPTHIITACGTGGTMAGLINGVAESNWNTKIIGIPVLKNGTFLKQDINDLLSVKNSNKHLVNWELFDSYHFGGYAKTNQELIDYGVGFFKKTGVKLDKIYTAKSFYAAYDLITKGEINANSEVLILHTGGLQGGSICDLG